MGRYMKKGWVAWLVHVFAYLAIWFSSWGYPELAEASPFDGVRSHGEVQVDSARQWSSNSDTKSCSSGTKNEFLLVVSTIDGAVSALDLRASGEILWSVKADERPLLSSSITKIQVTRNGVETRLIPSLDGELYIYDGEAVQAAPISAESLLSSSVRLTDNCVMVGASDVGSYGLDVQTGQIMYQCTTDGCKETSEANQGSGDMLVITRNMKTVRAVDVNSGMEKWNFSVGQHDLFFVASNKQDPGIEHENSDTEIDDEDVTLINCTPSGLQDDESDILQEDEMKRLIKVIVSDGRIVSLNPENPTQMSWSRKFSSPVARAWILHNGKVEKVSLFDSNVVPALPASHPFQFLKEERDKPLLYVGTHKRQLYVQKQESESIRCQKELLWPSHERELENKGLPAYPHVSWKPYLRSAPYFTEGYQTPLFGGNEAPEIPLLGRGRKPQKIDTSLAVWHDEYPFDTGYFLYPHYQVEERTDSNWQIPPAEEGIMDVLPASLWIWWKEVVSISLLTSLVIHILLTRFTHRPNVEGGSQSLDRESSNSLLGNDSSSSLAEDKQLTPEFKSRFADEFECIEQLGKGGFGIVFRAKNKVDEQEYAVKRIALPNSDDAIKKKMLREVRTLAMLDHVGIVRYFHSWIEDPPPGWQEERDKEFNKIFGDGFSPTTDTSITSVDQSHKTAAFHRHSSEQYRALRKQPLLLTDIEFSQDGDSELSAHLFGQNLSGSGEFSVHSLTEASTDESGSFSLAGEDHRCPVCEKSQGSLSIVFQNSDAEHSISRREKGESLLFRHDDVGKTSSCAQCEAGFNHKKEDSYSIVFENSHDSDRRGFFSHFDGIKSVGCSDSSYGGSIGDNEHSDHLREFHQIVNFTLSGHRDMQQLPGEKEEGEKKDKGTTEKVAMPKLYLYLQMQLCRLETLRDWLMANTLNRERNAILDIFEQIISAVDYVHSKGLIHRDLKPSNIFFALDGTVKVGDFGLVTAAENQAAEDCSQTQCGKASAKHTADVGTQLYMSPEQVQKKPYDQKVDVFSLGLIFLELLMPFSTAMERVATLQNARKGVFPERFCRELHIESELVKQLTSSNPQKRPSTQQVLEHNLLKDFCPRRVGIRF